MLIEIFCLGPAQTNCILLACSETKKTAVIDAPVGAEEVLQPKIEAEHLKPEMLLLTHSHWDHTAQASILKKKLKIPIFVHQLDASNVEEPGSDGLPLLIDVPPAKVDHFLEDGQEMSLGNLKIRVIHTPGHTPGGVCFYLPEENTLISGDTLFQGTIGNLSFPTAQPDKMWTSLEKLSALPPNTRVIPGHGSETTIGAESWLTNAKEYFGG